jgi:hypothetical protein
MTTAADTVLPLLSSIEDASVRRTFVNLAGYVDAEKAAPAVQAPPVTSPDPRITPAMVAILTALVNAEQAANKA